MHLLTDDIYWFPHFSYAQVDLVLEHNNLEKNVEKMVDDDFPSLVLENQKRIETVGKSELSILINSTDW